MSVISPPCRSRATTVVLSFSRWTVPRGGGMGRTDLTVCSTGIRRTEGNHVIPLGFVHANVSAHLLSFPEGSEEWVLPLLSRRLTMEESERPIVVKPTMYSY